jgi:hypothetical protein
LDKPFGENAVNPSDQSKRVKPATGFTLFFLVKIFNPLACCHIADWPKVSPGAPKQSVLRMNVLTMSIGTSRRDAYTGHLHHQCSLSGIIFVDLIFLPFNKFFSILSESLTAWSFKEG